VVMSRSTRSGSRRQKPNAALYVGYVEDDETPDMIMKKFAQMEAIQQAAKKTIKAGRAGRAGKSGKSGKAEMSDSDEEADAVGANANANADGSALTEEQLVSLFNDTSYYSVNSLQRNNDIMFQKQTVDEEGFVVGIDDPDYEKLMFEVDYSVANTAMMDWMPPDEEDYIGADEFWDADDADQSKNGANAKAKGKGRRPRSTVSRAGSGSGSGSSDKRDRFSGHAIGSSALHRGSGGGDADADADEQGQGQGDDAAKANAKAKGRGRTKAKLFCHEPFYLKVPAYPIPRSWLRSIARIDNRTAAQLVGSRYEERDILSMLRTEDFARCGCGVESAPVAILMDPPFDLSESPVHVGGPGREQERGTVSLSDFAKLPIATLVPDTASTMLFMWIPAELTMQVNEICEQWGFVLVEHATWIMRNLRYQIENRESRLLGLSKHNLMLYRRTKKNGVSYNKLELRHQRTSDSYFDFARTHPQTGRELKSDYHYNVIETLLPDLDRHEAGSALFLWAPKNERRDGWTCICDTKQLEMLARNKPAMDIGDW